jgi:ABC-type sugar transport system substrate-binding protein
MKKILSVAAITTSLALVGWFSATGSGAVTRSHSSVPTANSVVNACLRLQPYAKQASQTVNTTAYKKRAPWVLGVSAATTTSDSYIVYWNAELKYAVSRDHQFSKMIEYDASYNASTQISQIQSLIRQHVSAIVFTPSDSKAIEPALAQAHKAGIPTIEGTSAFIPDPNITAIVTVNLWKYYVQSAAQLFQALGGKGQVAMTRTVAGITEDTIQTAAVNCVLKHYPGIKIVSSEFTDYATPQAETDAQAWAVRYPHLAGVLSVYAETSVGVFNAFDAAGRISQIKIAPGNVENGWLKILYTHPFLNLGGVAYPVTTSENTVAVTAEILSGKSVPEGTLLGANYIPPKAYVAQVRINEPDTYWPNDLPPSFQPK